MVVGGGGLPSVLAETRWLETAFSHLKQSCGVEKSCVRFVSLDEVPVERSGSTKLIGYPMERTSGKLAHLVFHLIATEWLTMDSLDNTP